MTNTAVVDGVGVSKFGPWLKVQGHEGYLNPSKFAKLDMTNIKKGDTVQYEADGKYIKSIKVLGEGAVLPSGETVKPFVQGPPSNKDEQIARSTAVKSVMGSTVLLEQFKTKDISEVVADSKAIIEEMTRYILTGSFVEKAD